MLPSGNERRILKVIQNLKVADPEVMAQKIVLSPGYVEEICQSLIEKGFIFQNVRGKYQLTAKGENFNLVDKYIVTPHRATKYRDY